MHKPNIADLEKELEKKQKKRGKKKRPGMKVSGSKVKDLQRLIRDKNRNS